MVVVNKRMSFLFFGMDLFFFKCFGIKFDVVYLNVIIILFLGVMICEEYIDVIDGII